MRRKLIATSFALVAIVGVVGGVAYASAGDPAVTQTTTTQFGGETTAPDVGAPTDAVPPVPGSIDPAGAQAVLELLGINSEQLTCIADQLATGGAAPGDDQAALTALLTCGVSLSQLIDGLAQLNDIAGGAVPTTAPGAPTTAVASSPLLEIFQERLAAQGITLTAEQAQCLLDNISDFDPNDLGSMLSIMEDCGISLADILPGS